jgi:hypothetical protein
MTGTCSLISRFGSPMKILLALIIVLLVAALIYGDYKWRQWMVDRRRDRQ